jgi:hypothetical protein
MTVNADIQASKDRILIMREQLEKLEAGPSQIGQMEARFPVFTNLQEYLNGLDTSAIVSTAQGKESFKQTVELKTLLEHSRHCLASDHQDRVYAFLGLAH